MKNWRGESFSIFFREVDEWIIAGERIEVVFGAASCQLIKNLNGSQVDI